MFDFFKKISTPSPQSQTNQEHPESSFQVHMIECANVSDFLQINFPLLSQRNELYSEKQKALKGMEKEIDISVYFTEKDRYLALTHDKTSILVEEYKSLTQNFRLNQVKQRLIELEGYDQILTNIMKKSFAKNYDKFQEGINNLEFFKYVAEISSEDIKKTRKIIKDIKEDFSLGTLRVDRLLKQKALKQKALEFLKKFKEHFGAIYKIIATLDRGDLTEAYKLVPAIHKIKEEFEKEASLLVKFDCLHNYEHYFETRLEELKRDIREGLETILIKYDEKKFRSYLLCHFMFEIYTPCEISLPDQISDILRKSIKLARNQVIETFILNKTIQKTSDEEKKKATDYIKSVPKEMIPKFMSQIFHQMSLIMLNTHLCCRHLDGHQKDEVTIEYGEKITNNLTEFYSSIKMKMLVLRKEIWDMIQKKVAKIYKKAQIQDMGYNDLLSLVQFSSKFIDIGEDFSYSSSPILRKATLGSLKDYYMTFHNASLQNLRSMISVEEWQRLPLPEDYKNPIIIGLIQNFPEIDTQVLSLFDLEKSKQKSLKDMQNSSALSEFVSRNPFQVQERGNKGNVYTQSPQKGSSRNRETNFSGAINGVQVNGEAIKSLSEDPEENQEVVVSSTSNFIVKNFEKYLLLMNLIRQNALEIFTGLVNTFEFFIYAVIKYFIPGQFRNVLFTKGETELNHLPKIKDDEPRMITLENLHDLYLYHKSYLNIRQYMPKLLELFDNNPNLKIGDDGTNEYSFLVMSDLGRRSIAIESLIFSFSHLKYLKNNVYNLIENPEQKKIAEGYYKTFEKALPELRTFVYACFMPNILKNENIFLPIQNMKWELPEVSENPHPYISKIIQFITDFHGQIENLDKEGVLKRVQKDLKKDAINYIFRKLIDNFSNIKNVNVPGRNMMLTDFYGIVKGLEPVMDQRCNEKKELCEKYVKSWFLSLDELINFTNDNKELYGLRELNSLLRAHPTVKALNKQQKKELFSKIETEFSQFLKNKLQNIQ